MKVLVITPDIHRLGGVANHYLGLQSQWTLDVDYMYIGKRKDKEWKLETALHYISSFFCFAIALKKKKYDVVILNPSLRRFQIKRDSLYIRIAKHLKCKVITFIHGFGYDFYEQLKKDPRHFASVYNYSTFIYVLYSDFAFLLKGIGISSPILQTTTKVAEEFSDIIQLTSPRRTIGNILFVGRLVKEKGIHESLKVFDALFNEQICNELVFCGEGPEKSSILKFSKDQKLNVICRGTLVGDDLANAYKNADVLFLLSHGEGLATCILEAMAFGLVIIATPVGGINDFFEDGWMGYLVDKDDIHNIIEKMVFLAKHPAVVQRISTYNKYYAKKHFMASAVAKQIEGDIIKYCS